MQVAGDEASAALQTAKQRTVLAASKIQYRAHNLLKGLPKEQGCLARTLSAFIPKLRQAVGDDRVLSSLSRGADHILTSLNKVEQAAKQVVTQILAPEVQIATTVTAVYVWEGSGVASSKICDDAY